MLDRNTTCCFFFYGEMKNIIPELLSDTRRPQLDACLTGDQELAGSTTLDMTPLG